AVAYGESAPELWIGQPANQQPAAAGNGVHIALKARNKQAVHDFHEAALAAGGSDEGGPGPRPQYSPEYYGAFVRDPDGNKIEAMLMVGIDDVPATASRGGSGKRASVRKGASRGKAKARRAAVKSAGGR